MKEAAYEELARKEKQLASVTQARDEYEGRANRAEEALRTLQVEHVSVQKELSLVGVDTREAVEKLRKEVRHAFLLSFLNLILFIIILVVCRGDEDSDRDTDKTRGRGRGSIGESQGAIERSRDGQEPRRGPA